VWELCRDIRLVTAIESREDIACSEPETAYVTELPRQAMSSPSPHEQNLITKLIIHD
jgi:hypothetical protein